MPAILIKHKVADFAVWHKAYQDHGATRTAAGALGSLVCQGEDDPSSVTVVIEFQSLDQARAFLASEELARKMQAAGVLGPPSFEFLSTTRRYPS